jgi:hypothetical protein
MSENIGWISLHRRVQKHWIWNDPVKFQWWIDILLTVNVEDKKVNIGYQIFDCKRGQSLLSLSSWASRWKVSKDTARNFIKLLQFDGMVECVSIGKSTRLTVCKFDDYQVGLHVNQTQSKRKPNATPTQLNNEDNDNKEDNISFVEFWNLYGKKEGDKKSVEKKWNKLSKDVREKIMVMLPAFKIKHHELKYRPLPETFINQERWNDEISPAIKNVINEPYSTGTGW